MKALPLAILILALFAPAVGAAEPTWDKNKAAERLDARAKWWQDGGTSQRATDATGKTACLSCHSTVPYALARPALAAAMSATPAAPLERLLRDTDRRLVAWGTYEESYTFSADKKKESRGTEAVLSALVLSWNDATRGETAPVASTKKAFDRLWETQRADGAWDWLRFGLEPWETKDAEYFGAAQAALAVGTAPGYYTGESDPNEKKIEALRKYLKDKRDQTNLHAETWLLLASTRLKGLLTDAERTQVIDALKAKSQPTKDGAGGWILLELANWKYSGDAPPANPPKLNPAAKALDGYATGLVTYTLLKAGVKANDPKVAAGLKWLGGSQRNDGSWPAVSLNKDREAGNLAEFFMSDAATAWAVLALLEGETKKE